MSFSWLHKQSKNRWFTLLFWLIVACILFIPKLIDLNVFFARDELAVWRWSDGFTRAIWAGDLRGTHDPENYYPAIPMFWGQTIFLTLKYHILPGLFSNSLIPLDMLDNVREINLLAERRFVSGIMVGLQMLLSIWLVERLFGRWVALFSAILIGLDPFTLAETRVFRLQMLSTMFVCLSGLGYMLYLKERRKAWIFFSGLMAGLGVSSQTSSGFIVPFVGLLLLADMFFSAGQSWGQRIKQFFGHGFLWALSAIGIFWLIWPAMWVDPLWALESTYIKGLAQAASASVWHGDGFFMGQIMQDDPGPLFYFVVFPFRTTPITWLGLLSVLVMAITISYKQLKNKVHPFKDEPILWRLPWTISGIWLLVLVNVLIWLGLSLILSKVDRYLLELYPFMSILSAIGLVYLAGWGINKINQKARLNPKAMLTGVASIIAIVSLITLIPVHPHYYTYWNPLMGGGAKAQTLLPMGHGEGIDGVINYINSQPGGTEATLVCGGSEPWCEYLFAGESMRHATFTDGRWAEADYISFYISHMQKNTYPQEVVDFFMARPADYKFEVDGATYAWLYKVPKTDYHAGRRNELAGLARLLGYSLNPPANASLPAGETLELSAMWVNLGAGPTGLIARLTDASGYEWASAPIIPQAQYADIPADKTAIIEGSAAIKLPPTLPPQTLYLEIGAVDEAGQLLGQFELDPPANRITAVTGNTIITANDVSIPHKISNSALLGYDLSQEVLAPTQPTWLSLYWQTEATPGEDSTAITLQDENGNVVFQWQDSVRPNHVSRENWPTNSVVQDVWPLDIPADLPVDSYQLNVVDGAEVIPLTTLEVWENPLSYDRPTMQSEAGVNFNNALTLLGYDLFFDTTPASDTHRLIPQLYWQSQKDMSAGYEVFITLRDPATNTALGYWQVPLGHHGPKEKWKADEVLSTIYGFDTDNILHQNYHLDIAVQKVGASEPETVILPDGSSVKFITLENIQEHMVTRILR